MPYPPAHHLLALTNGRHHGTNSDCCPPLMRIQITLGLPAHLAWPLTACSLASGNIIAVPLATQISNLHTQYKGGYMCGSPALYGQSEGSHTFYAKRLATCTCTPLVRHDSPFQPGGAISVASANRSDNSQTLRLKLGYRNFVPCPGEQRTLAISASLRLHFAWTVRHLTSSLLA